MLLAAGAAFAHKHGGHKQKDKTDTHTKGTGEIWLLKAGGTEPCMQCKGIGTSVGNTDKKDRKERREMVIPEGGQEKIVELKTILGGTRSQRLAGQTTKEETMQQLSFH